MKVGRWNVRGKPIVFLVDFTTLFPDKDKMLHHLWVRYGLDSLSGQWDYKEPLMFGYAAGKVIEFFYRYHVNSNERVVAHFHDWMTGGGMLYLDEYVPQLATVFTAHSTVLGRSLAGSGRPFYQKKESLQPERFAKELNVVAKHSLEKIAVSLADCFTSVSGINGLECENLLKKKPDIITPNGYDLSLVPNSAPAREKTERGKKTNISGSGGVVQPAVWIRKFVGNKERAILI